MNMNELPPTSPATSPEVFQQLGLITRQLHDTLNQLGVMPKLQHAVDGLPDARSRLSYIARKTGEAADKVLNAVDLAKHEQTGIAGAARQLAEIGLGAAGPAATGAGAMRLVGEIEAGAARTDAILTDIMLAQDFHDLTGQVVTAVVALAPVAAGPVAARPISASCRAAPAMPVCSCLARSTALSTLSAASPVLRAM